MSRAAFGCAPLVPLNKTSVVIVLLPLGNPKTVPSPLVPPNAVVPYRLPLLSMISPASGEGPLLLKEARAVMVPLPCASSKTEPKPELLPEVVAP